MGLILIIIAHGLVLTAAIGRLTRAVENLRKDTPND